jgi:hypothetical protein
MELQEILKIQTTLIKDTLEDSYFEIEKKL